MSEQVPNMYEQKTISDLIVLASGLEETVGDLAGKLKELAEKERKQGELSQQEISLATSLYFSMVNVRD